MQFCRGHNISTIGREAAPHRTQTLIIYQLYTCTQPRPCHKANWAVHNSMRQHLYNNPFRRQQLPYKRSPCSSRPNRPMQVCIYCAITVQPRCICWHRCIEVLSNRLHYLLVNLLWSYHHQVFSALLCMSLCFLLCLYSLSNGAMQLHAYSKLLAD